MKTIGAKDLRQNLDEVLDRVINGEDIIVQHRFKKPVRLSALNTLANKNHQKLAGLKAFEDAPKQPSPFNPNKSIKELYHESISDKYAS
jgi:antitoxin (DNA-binding transcriptional repressor) of toxin-antitoxin stability system